MAYCYALVTTCPQSKGVSPFERRLNGWTVIEFWNGGRAARISGSQVKIGIAIHILCSSSGCVLAAFLPQQRLKRQHGRGHSSLAPGVAGLQQVNQDGLSCSAQTAHRPL